MILMLVCQCLCAGWIEYSDWMFKKECLLVDEIRMSRSMSTWQQMFVARAAAFNMLQRSLAGIGTTEDLG